MLQSGVATVLLDAHKDKELLSRLLNLYQPNLIWAPAEEEWGEVKAETDDYRLYRYSDKQHTIHPDVALLLTTSGSTIQGDIKMLREMGRITKAQKGTTCDSCDCSSSYDDDSCCCSSCDTPNNKNCESCK